jgi:hypothetical protein
MFVFMVWHLNLNGDAEGCSKKTRRFQGSLAESKSDTKMFDEEISMHIEGVFTRYFS